MVVSVTECSGDGVRQALNNMLLICLNRDQDNTTVVDAFKTDHAIATVIEFVDDEMFDSIVEDSAGVDVMTRDPPKEKKNYL